MGRASKRKEPSRLIDRAANLKSELQRYVEQPPLRDVMRDSFDPDVTENPALAAMAVDDFIFGYRFPDGSTVIDSFLRQRPELSAADRETLLAWRYPVKGVFEVLHKSRGTLVLANLIDDLEYRAHCKFGNAYAEALTAGWFLECRLLQAGSSWIILGTTVAESPEGGRKMALRARAMLDEDSTLAFRNPRLADYAWATQRKMRARFIDFFGTDEVILLPAKAAEQVGECFGSAEVVGFRVPGKADDDSAVGLIFDEQLGLMCLSGYGMLRDLFAEPALISDPAHAQMLADYLESEETPPQALRRMARTYPDHADQVFQAALQRPEFCWQDDLEETLRARKPRYYTKAEAQPSAITLTARLTELLAHA